MQFLPMTWPVLNFSLHDGLIGPFHLLALLFIVTILSTLFSFFSASEGQNVPFAKIGLAGTKIFFKNLTGNFRDQFDQTNSTLNLTLV